MDRCNRIKCHSDDGESAAPELPLPVGLGEAPIAENATDGPSHDGVEIVSMCRKPKEQHGRRGEANENKGHSFGAYWCNSTDSFLARSLATPSAAPFSVNVRLTTTAMTSPLASCT